MIEFAAVIQQIVVTPAATTMLLDISLLDVSTLTALIDQEVAITIKQKAAPRKGTKNECE